MFYLDKLIVKTKENSKALTSNMRVIVAVVMISNQMNMKYKPDHKDIKSQHRKWINPIAINQKIIHQNRS